MFFIDGKRHGEFKKWHENGNIQCFRRYRNGKVVGSRFDYDENGCIVFEYHPPNERASDNTTQNDQE